MPECPVLSGRGFAKSLKQKPIGDGGRSRTRTCDPLIKSQSEEGLFPADSASVATRPSNVRNLERGSPSLHRARSEPLPSAHRWPYHTQGTRRYFTLCIYSA